VSNFEGTRAYGAQVGVDRVGGVGGMLGLHSAWSSWRGEWCGSGFLSMR